MGKEPRLTMFDTISLGEFIRLLKTCKKDAWIRFDFCYFAPDYLHSYRGWYEHLAFSCGRTWQSTLAKDVLIECEQAIGRTYRGYKGGDYVMDENTPLWVDESENASGTAIVNIKDLDYEVVIETKFVET